MTGSFLPLLCEVEERVGERRRLQVLSKDKPLSPCPLPAALRREREKTSESFAQLA